MDESGRIWWGGGRETTPEILNGDLIMIELTCPLMTPGWFLTYMYMANDIAILQALRSGIVIDSWVDKNASIQVIHLEFDSEICVGVDIVTRARARKNCGDHVTEGRDVAHDYS